MISDAVCREVLSSRAEQFDYLFQLFGLAEDVLKEMRHSLSSDQAVLGQAAVAALIRIICRKPISATDFSDGRFLHSSVRAVNFSRLVSCKCVGSQYCVVS